MLKKQLYISLIVTFMLVTLIYGFILIPFEKQRLQNVEQKVELLLNTIMEQRISEIGNLLFLKNIYGLRLLTRRISKLDDVINVETYDNKGTLLTSTNLGLTENIPLTQADFPKDYSFVSGLIDGKKTAVYTKTVSVAGENYGLVRIYYSMNDIASEATKSIVIFAAQLISILIASLGVLTLFISRKVVVPLTDLAHSMSELEHGKLGAQARVTGNNELSIISETFNRMSAENARMYHELETVNVTLEQKVEERTLQLERKNEELEKLAVKDELTQLANRRGFEQMFEHEWSSAQRSEKPISLIVFDIDFFKNYNDTYGHQAGDECLKMIADIFIKNTTRSTDIAARYGGEEFAIILSHTHMEGAIYVAELIRREVMDAGIPHEASDISDVITISVGIASTIPSRNDKKELLFEQADQALYTSKKQGRNRTTPFNF